MEHWDDIRYFLAVARQGSVRGASDALSVNHSTVLRRVAHMEARLGARLFEKLPTGYKLTIAGAEILQFAEAMEQTSSLLETRVFARDQRLTGSLHVTLPPPIATDLLMQDIAEFSQAHPEIDLKITSTYDTINLTKRQADVAVRLVRNPDNMPQNLYRTRLQDFYRGVFISHRLLGTLQHDTNAANKWVLTEGDGDLPEWALARSLATNLPPLTVNDLSTKIAAVKAGIGMALLPCFIGDAEPNLIRAPNSTIKFYGTLWLLTHGETRKSKRVRLFCDFIKKRIARHADLLNGNIQAD